jgi:hypothetical protein
MPAGHNGGDGFVNPGKVGAMGLFKSMKDLKDLTKEAKEMQNQQLQEQGYKPGMRGQMSQMGDMISQSKDMLSEISDDSGKRGEILANGLPGEGVILGHSVPERGAQWFNMTIDMEIHVSGREPYRVNKMYMVPATAQIGQGVRLPLKVDPSDQAEIAIDWDQAPKPPAQGEVRSASEGAAPAASAPAPSAAPSGGTDTVAQLEKLAKLRDSGALTDAEFEQQKAKVLGS